MKVIVTNNAYNDLIEFENTSKMIDVNRYITSILNYSSTLENFNKLGKCDFTIKTKIKEYEIRKLIYKHHKILYYIDNNIHIVGFIHSKMDKNKYISKLKKFIANY